MRRVLADDDPENHQFYRSIEVSYFRFGEIHASLGSQERLPLMARLDHWNSAQQWFTKARDRNAERQARGWLGFNEKHYPDSTRAHIAWCEEEMKRLGAELACGPPIARSALCHFRFGEGVVVTSAPGRRSYICA